MPLARCDSIRSGLRSRAGSVFLVLATSLCLAAPVRAQEPLEIERLTDETPAGPDRIELLDGAVRQGQVASVHGDEILLMVKGRRMRIPKARIAETELRRDRVAQFLSMRLGAPDTVAAQWTLIEHAIRVGLPALARLQALDLVLQAKVTASTPANELDTLARAHQLLGNRPHGTSGRWRWREDGSPKARLLTYERWLEQTSNWGRALVLRSEHFEIRTNGGPHRAVTTLFDLEALYVWMHETFGEGLQMQEILDPVEVRVWGSAAEFPAWNANAITSLQPFPHFIPNPFADAVFTHYRAGEDRPAELFDHATQAILYRTVVTTASVTDPQERFATWAELGLGRWVATCESADSSIGYARFGLPVRPAQAVALALESRKHHDIDAIQHFSIRAHFYNPLARHRELFWADAHMLVAYLMADQDLRARFFEYLRGALGDGRGGSSFLDKKLGRKIETLEEPWVQWLRAP